MQHLRRVTLPTLLLVLVVLMPDNSSCRCRGHSPSGTLLSSGTHLLALLRRHPAPQAAEQPCVPGGHVTHQSPPLLPPPPIKPPRFGSHMPSYHKTYNVHTCLRCSGDVQRFKLLNSPVCQLVISPTARPVCPEPNRRDSNTTTRLPGVASVGGGWSGGGIRCVWELVGHRGTIVVVVVRQMQAWLVQSSS